MLICYETNKQKEEICQIARDCGIVFYPECVEIRANNIDKATAIQKIKHHFELDRIICFGDGENDIEMLHLVGTSIAMGNADVEVKKLASTVTLTVDKDCIADFFEKEFKIK